MRDKNPWLGLASYEENDSHLFCGRDEETMDLVRLIDNNLFVTLYGSSGIGKTSLLKAGVIPILKRRGYYPMYVRLSQEPRELSYAEVIVRKLKSSGLKEDRSIEMEYDDSSDLYFWNYFATTRFLNNDNREVYPILILDQFEEIFRDADKSKAELLLRQIYLLINNELDIPDKEGYNSETNYRFVASIREDFLFVLEDSIDKFSMDIYKNNRYRLRSLSQKGAEAAISIPGKDCIVENQMDAVVQKIIELSTQSADERIDTLLLSLVCAGTFNKKVGDKITSSDLNTWKKDNLMEDYFHDAIMGIEAGKVQYIVKHLIHEDGSRRQVDIRDIKIALGETDFNTLTKGKNRILTVGEHDQVELLHDMLAKAVSEERKALVKRENVEGKIGAAFYAVSVAILIVSLIYSIRQMSDNIRWFEANSQALYYVEKSKNLYGKDNRLAHLLLLETFPKNIDSKPYITEAEQALRLFTNSNLDIHTNNNSAPSDNQPLGNQTALDEGQFHQCENNKSVNIEIKHRTSDTLHFSEKKLKFIDYIGDITVSAIGDSMIAIHKPANLFLFLLRKEYNDISFKYPRNGSINCISINHNGSQFVSASSDSTIIIWDSDSGAPLKIIKGHDGGVNSAYYSSDDKYIVSASNDSTVKVWRVDDGKEVFSFAGHQRRVLLAEFSPDNRHIFSCSDDSTVLVWPFPPLQELIDQTRERFKDRPLTDEERKMYYLE